jgi:hypothetical protein
LKHYASPRFWDFDGAVLWFWIGTHADYDKIVG